MARHVPGIEIDWLVERSFAAMPEQHRAVRRVISLQWRKWRKSLRSPDTRAALKAWRAEMQRRPYDLIIDPAGTRQSAAFILLRNGPRAGYDQNEHPRTHCIAVLWKKKDTYPDNCMRLSVAAAFARNCWATKTRLPHQTLD